MTTFDICVKTPQLIDSLHKNIFFQINKKINSNVGDMTFQMPDGKNFVEVYLSGASFLYHFLGAAPTSICHFPRPSVRPSVHPSVAHHISGTIHHLIIIFGTHM